MTMDQDDQRDVLRAQLRSKATRNPADMELYELSQLSGITMDPHVFEILLDLLRHNVPPEAIVQMLRSMCSSMYQQLQQQNLSQSSRLTSSASTPALISAPRQPPPSDSASAAAVGSSSARSDQSHSHSHAGRGDGGYTRNQRNVRDVPLSTSKTAPSSANLKSASSMGDLHGSKEDTTRDLGQHKKQQKQAQATHRVGDEGSGFTGTGSRSSSYTATSGSKDSSLSGSHDRFVTTRQRNRPVSEFSTASTSSKSRSYHYHN